MRIRDLDTPVLQHSLPEMPWMDPRLARLPGVLPVTPPSDWLRVDEAYGAQMALRRALIDERRDRVHALPEGARAAAVELLETALPLLPALGYTQTGARVTCPDGESIPLDWTQPLITWGRMMQADACLMMADGDEHKLAGAILCFPASWSLDEKLGHPLTRVHRPVEGYEGGLARRVQRLFDAVRADQPLWRANALDYDDPALFQPRRENARRDKPQGPRRFIRSERQVMVRLPRTGAVAFVIHTIVIPREILTPEQEAAFARHHQPL